MNRMIFIGVSFALAGFSVVLFGIRRIRNVFDLFELPHDDPNKISNEEFVKRVSGGYRFYGKIASLLLGIAAGLLVIFGLIPWGMRKIFCRR